MHFPFLFLNFWQQKPIFIAVLFIFCQLLTWYFHQVNMKPSVSLADFFGSKTSLIFLFRLFFKKQMFSYFQGVAICPSLWKKTLIFVDVSIMQSLGLSSNL